jgi:hypothetical protein
LVAASKQHEAAQMNVYGRMLLVVLPHIFKTDGARKATNRLGDVGGSSNLVAISLRVDYRVLKDLTDNEHEGKEAHHVGLADW